MKTALNSALHSIRRHSVLTELVLVGFAVIAFVVSLMLGLPSDAARNAAQAAPAQASIASPGGSDPAGS